MNEVDLEDLNDEDEDESMEEVSFSELFGEALAQGTTVVSIDSTEISRVKRGIVNAKQSARKRANRNKLAWDRVTLEFKEEPDPEAAGFTLLTVMAAKKAVVKVRKMGNIDLAALEGEEHE